MTDDSISFTGKIQRVVGHLPVGSMVQVAIVIDKPPAEVEELSPELFQLLQKCAHVFVVPSGLPPYRNCDRAIPLVPGASPINVRPHTYPRPSKMRLNDKFGICYSLVSFSLALAPSPHQFG